MGSKSIDANDAVNKAKKMSLLDNSRQNLENPPLHCLNWINPPLNDCISIYFLFWMETWLDSGLSVLSMCVSVAWHRQSRVAVDSGVQHQELREEGATTTTAHNTTTTLVPVWPDPSPSIGTSPPIPQAVKYFLCGEKLFWWFKSNRRSSTVLFCESGIHGGGAPRVKAEIFKALSEFPNDNWAIVYNPT